jgi:DNA-binding PadR family transcriptional regulator
MLVTGFGLSDNRYGLNQLGYDLRKMRAHALLERDGNRYVYRLTDKGVKVALLFLLFHQRLYCPLANSLFHHRPDANYQPDRKLDKAVHKADDSIRKVIQLLEAT